MSAQGSHYEVLGVSEDASQADIKAAYRRLAVRFHPDISHERDCEERFAAISEAHTVLSDMHARAHYDFARSAPQRAAAAAAAARHRSVKADPFYEMLLRQEEYAKFARERFSVGSAADWEERRQFWELEKAEAAAYKERRERLHSRMRRAHDARIALALSSQWPAHFGMTRNDAIALSLFLACSAAIGTFWLLPSAPRGSGAHAATIAQADRTARMTANFQSGQAAATAAPYGVHGGSSHPSGSARQMTSALSTSFGPTCTLREHADVGGDTELRRGSHGSHTHNACEGTHASVAAFYACRAQLQQQLAA